MDEIQGKQKHYDHQSPDKAIARELTLYNEVPKRNSGDFTEAGWSTGEIHGCVERDIDNLAKAKRGHRQIVPLKP